MENQKSSFHLYKHGNQQIKNHSAQIEYSLFSKVRGYIIEARVWNSNQFRPMMNPVKNRSTPHKAIILI